MPIIQTRKLILVEARQIEFVGRDGEHVKKWKYTFLDKNEKLSVAYDDMGLFANDVQEVEGWNPNKAKDFTFTMREFQGQTKLQLYAGTPDDARKYKDKPKEN